MCEEKNMPCGIEVWNVLCMMAYRIFVYCPHIWNTETVLFAFQLTENILYDADTKIVSADFT